MPVILPEKTTDVSTEASLITSSSPRVNGGFGITANYGELQTEDIQVLSILKNVDFNGKMYSIKPYVSYFVRSNQSVGLKFDYTRGIADLGSLSNGLRRRSQFQSPAISAIYQQSFSVAAFHRAYVGLDSNGRFGIFNEVDLSFGSGSSRFKRLYNGEPKDTRTIITQGASTQLQPRVCVFCRILCRSMCRLAFRFEMAQGESEYRRCRRGFASDLGVLISALIYSILTLA